MAQANKIDSNITGLAYAEEAELGVLPGENGTAGTPVWHRLSPNSYNDFGGEIITVAPNPINPSRQRRKGVTTDLNASGGFNQNITFTNLTNLMQGVMFANIRFKAREVVTNVATVGTGTENDYHVADSTGFFPGALIKGTRFNSAANNALHRVDAVTATTVSTVGNLTAEAPPNGARIDVVGVAGAPGDIDVDVTGDLPALTSVTLNFTTLGIIPGEWVYIGGDAAGTSFVNAVNNGFKRVRSITANRMTFDKSYDTMVVESSTAENIHIYFGDVLRNETGTLIRRRTYNVERTLGAPDTANAAAIQSEVLKGALANEFSLNIPTADLLNVDFSFVAIDNEQRTAAMGPKQADVRTPPPAVEYNTSSDIGRIRLSTIVPGAEAPQPLFAFVTDATLAINNNVSPNKAIGILGAFDVTAGTFAVNGNLTAYFSDVTATQAVRNNENVTLDMSFVKDNTAMFFDLPLLSLGDGRLNVEIDQPINLPLALDAASGEDVNSNLDHTLLITYFNYIPDSAH